ncbi:acyltransferase family protein [Gaetbulibacter aestuarii]|uniref:Acyltransferase family protein n=1 Tax=Gaetbulibacter aestuarii TaxID=1502358 RepID=A0ABW7MUZ5_9FLAO
MKTQRRYDIDWIRVIAIGLLLIYHIAILFQPWALFIGFIKNDDSISWLWTPMTMLNVWRIPLLFYVSGMGLYFAMRKRNWKQLLLERTKRIFIPFVFGFLAITPIHVWLFQKFYNLPLTHYPGSAHLWFLGNIFAYVIILSPLFFYLKKHENGRFKKILSKFMSFALAPLTVALFYMAELVLVKPQLFELYAQTWHGFFLGLLAFLFGFLFVYSGRSFWQTVSKWKWLYLIIASVLFALRLTNGETDLMYYLKAVEFNGWILAVFGIGFQYLNKPSARLQYLSQAAYPVYIIHMFVLFGAAVIILPLALHPVWKFIAITLITFSVCMVLYEFIIRRISFLRPLFGLKWNWKLSKQNKASNYTGIARSTTAQQPHE